MTAIRFRVDGLPPKKDGANSMWGKPLEAERLVSLRKAALKAMNGRSPMKNNIGLSISVCVGSKNDRSVGDLDTFITGICDGLMKAAPRCKLCTEIWDRAENSIRPNKVIAIDDDSQVVSIQAVKVKDATGMQFYDVALEAELEGGIIGQPGSRKD